VIPSLSRYIVGDVAIKYYHNSALEDEQKDYGAFETHAIQMTTFEDHEATEMS
jgi:hypothetical protein